MEAIRTSIRKKLNFVQNSVFSICSATSETGNKERYINLAGSPQSIGGQSRFTIANDGEKDRLALLITREMIAKIQINVNLMGIELYNSFELRVSPEAIQDVDLLPYDDVLEHQDWDEDHSESMFSAQSVQTELTPEELYRRELHERYNETSWALCHARENYHNYTNLHYTQDQWKRDVEEGNAKASKSECDRIILNDAMWVTAGLIDAEEAFVAAEAEADKLGLLDEMLKNDSCFFGWDNRSSPEAQATHAVGGLDRARIEAWMENLDDSSGLEDNNALPEADIWDAEPVRVLDSLSVIDRENYGKTIRRWRKLGEAQRDVDGSDVQEEDTWNL